MKFWCQIICYFWFHLHLRAGFFSFFKFKNRSMLSDINLNAVLRASTTNLIPIFLNCTVELCPETYCPLKCLCWIMNFLLLIPPCHVALLFWLQVVQWKTKEKRLWVLWRNWTTNNIFTHQLLLHDATIEASFTVATPVGAKVRPSISVNVCHVAH